MYLLLVFVRQKLQMNGRHWVVLLQKVGGTTVTFDYYHLVTLHVQLMEVHLQEPPH